MERLGFSKALYIQRRLLLIRLVSLVSGIPLSLTAFSNIFPLCCAKIEISCSHKKQKSAKNVRDKTKNMKTIF